jgi:hypothetical protein
MSTRKWKRADISTMTVLEVFARRAYPAGLVLAQETGAPIKVAWRAMEREQEAGHVECGLWLHGGWLTGEGEAELQRLRDAARADEPNTP